MLLRPRTAFGRKAYSVLQRSAPIIHAVRGVTDAIGSLAESGPARLIAPRTSQIVSYAAKGIGALDNVIQKTTSA